MTQEQGCSSHACLIAPPKGMGTNSGKCYCPPFLVRKYITTLRAEVERLTKENKGIVPKRIQPCGCQLCFCENQEQCQGCGAHHCSDKVCSVRRGILEYEHHPLLASIISERKAIAEAVEDMHSPFTTDDQYDAFHDRRAAFADRILAGEFAKGEEKK